VLAIPQWSSGTAAASSVTRQTDRYELAAGPLAAQAIEGYLAQHASTLAGAWMDEQSRTITVALAPAASRQAMTGVLQVARSATAAPEQASGTASVWWLRFVRAPYSFAELQQVMKSVTTEQPWARLSAPYLSSWYVNAAGDQVVIGLTRLTPQLLAAAARAFGDRARLVAMARPMLATADVTTRSAPRVVEWRARALRSGTGPDDDAFCSRLLDCTPYTAGDRIVWYQSNSSGTTIVQCTLGYPWVPKGKKVDYHVATTAGHCAPPKGVKWYQGYYDASTNVINTTGVLGTASKVSFGHSRVDGETIATTKRATLQPFVWITESLAPVFWATITASGPPMQGESICADGSFTLQSCGGIVKSTDVCGVFGDEGSKVRICDLAYATAKKRLVQSGDSGGPVYEYLSPHKDYDVRVNGTITADNKNGHDLWFSNLTALEKALSGKPFIASDAK
jgi:hypothetical protein